MSVNLDGLAGVVGGSEAAASAAVNGEFAQTLEALIEESGGASERARFEATLELVLVELDDPIGVRFVAHLAGRHELAVGLPMVARPGDDGTPRWELA